MLNTESGRIQRKIKSLEELLRDLEIDYEAKLETFKEGGKVKKIEKLKEEFTEKRSIYLKKREKYKVELDNIWKTKKLEQEMHERNVTKLQTFMDILSELEAGRRKPANRQMLIDHLVDSGRFTSIEAVSYIQQMLREATIYESKPNHYNRV